MKRISLNIKWATDEWMLSLDISKPGRNGDYGMVYFDLFEPDLDLLQCEIDAVFEYMGQVREL